MQRSIDFYFFYGSLHSYLSVMRIKTVASDISIRWRPFNLRQILVEQNNTGFAQNKAKMNYFWHDIERRALRHRLPFNGRVPLPADPDLLALKVGVIAAQEGWCAAYSQAVFEDWFRNKRAPGAASNIECILTSLNKPPTIIARAFGEEGNRLLERATSEARNLGIFGAPTFAIGTELFWGDDRLEEAVEFSRTQ